MLIAIVSQLYSVRVWGDLTHSSLCFFYCKILRKCCNICFLLLSVTATLGIPLTDLSFPTSPRLPILFPLPLGFHSPPFPPPLLRVHQIRTATNASEKVVSRPPTSFTRGKREPGNEFARPLVATHANYSRWLQQKGFRKILASFFSVFIWGFAMSINILTGNLSLNYFFLQFKHQLKCFC